MVQLDSRKSDLFRPDIIVRLMRSPSYTKVSPGPLGTFMGPGTVGKFPAPDDVVKIYYLVWLSDAYHIEEGRRQTSSILNVSNVL